MVVPSLLELLGIGRGLAVHCVNSLILADDPGCSVEKEAEGMQIGVEGGSTETDVCVVRMERGCK